MTIGKATYKPDEMVKTCFSLSGTEFCEVEHLGMYYSSATAAFEKGDIHTMNKGDLFISSEPHDSWVVGGDDYISLHFIERIDNRLNF